MTNATYINPSTFGRVKYYHTHTDLDGTLWKVEEITEAPAQAAAAAAAASNEGGQPAAGGDKTEE